MTTDQMLRCLLERAIAEGLVLPPNRFADPDPQKRTYEELHNLVQLVVRWNQGRTLKWQLSTEIPRDE